MPIHSSLHAKSSNTGARAWGLKVSLRFSLKIISARSGRSLGALPRTPSPSKVFLSLKTPSVEALPGVSFMPYNPQQLAGKTTEPLVSVPMPNGENPATIAVAGPDEEPPQV